MTPPLLIARNFRSHWLNRSRQIHICLPERYNAASQERYPVLYSHDAQNLFDATQAYAQVSWNLHDTIHALIKKDAIEPLILVAIDHGGQERLAEFAHQDRICDGQAVTARGSDYERFLIEELKPWIDRHFLTRSAADQSALMGSSMGGLVSINIGLRRPDTFGKIAALSPSFWWQPQALLTTLKCHQKALSQLQLWIDCGGREGEYGQLVPFFAERIRALKEDSHSTFRYYFDPHADHSEAAWGARVHLPLKFLFGKKQAQLS